VGTRCADHLTPLYPQMLALTSPTGGGRSVGIVRVRTKAMEFSLVFSSIAIPTELPVPQSETVPFVIVRDNLLLCVLAFKEEKFGITLE